MKKRISLAILTMFGLIVLSTESMAGRCYWNSTDLVCCETGEMDCSQDDCGTPSPDNP